MLLSLITLIYISHTIEVPPVVSNREGKVHTLICNILVQNYTLMFIWSVATNVA